MPSPNPQSHVQMSQGTYTQFSAHLQHYCLLHHDPKIPCIIFYGCVTHTATLATIVITLALLSQDNTVLVSL